MILWVKRLGLIAGLALIIFACEDSGEIGINLDPERGRFIGKYAEIPLKVSVIQIDTLLTSNRERVLVSRLEDPDFGFMKTNAFSRLYLSNSLKVDSTAVCDSLVLHVRLDYLYGPDDMLSQEISVHQLSDTFEVKNYFSRDSLPYSPMAIGDAMIDLSQFDTVRIDTAVSIQIQDSVGQWILNGIANDTLIGTDQNNFHAFFPGLALLPGSQNTKSIGIDLFDDKSKLSLYYHTDEDTLSVDFLFVSKLGEAQYFYNIDHDKSNTSLAGLVDFHQEYYPGDGNNYTQSGTGVLTRISMTPVIDFFDSIGNALVNSAELVVQTNDYPSRFEPPAGLELLILDEDNKFVVIGNTFKAVLDESAGRRENLVLRFVKNESTNQGSYGGFMTIFTQELVSSLREDSVLVFKPLNLNSTFDRFVGIDEDLKIKMYYSEIK